MTSDLSQNRTVRLSDEIIPKLREAFKDTEHSWIILTGGRASAKTSMAAIRTDFKTVSESECSSVVLRKFHNKIRKTVFKEMIRGINRLQIPTNRFKITVSPIEIKYKKNDNTIFFTGNDSIDDTKGMIDESRPIKYVVIDELTEFFEHGDGEDELLNIEATFSRGNDDIFQMIGMFNPPKNPNAPIMAWLAKMKLRPDVLHVHVDYRDVPPEWLGRKLLESAELLKQTDLKMYNWLWLGLCIGIDELIYYMFRADRHVKAPPMDDKGKYISPDLVGIGVDYGQMNATVFEAFGVYQKLKRVAGLGEYFHSGRTSGHQRSPSDYARDFVKFVEKIESVYSCTVQYAYIDPSAKGLAEEIKRAIPRILIRDAQNSVALGISRVQKVLTYNVLSIHEQPELQKEFGLYSYDKKSIERGTEQPIKENDHCQDATRYAIMGLWKQIKHFLPFDDKEEEI